jgi:hypothetical protein
VVDDAMFGAWGVGRGGLVVVVVVVVMNPG